MYAMLNFCKFLCHLLSFFEVLKANLFRYDNSKQSNMFIAGLLDSLYLLQYNLNRC